MAHARSTILHLSDLHFGDHHGFRTDSTDEYDRGVGSLLDHLTSDLDKIDCHPDILVVSGDLTSMAHGPEFQRASSFISELLGRHKLDKSRIVVVPGNHDVIWLPGDSEATLSEYNNFTSRLYQTPVQDYELRFATHGDLFVLGLDATRLETPARGGTGFVGRDQLQRAAELLDREAHDAMVRMLAIHHHLLPVAWIGDRPANYPASATLDSPSILAWAQEHRFAVILHGHQHQEFLCTFQFPARDHGPLVVSGSPSIGAKRESLPPNARNGYQIITVEGSDLEVETRLMNSTCEFEARPKTFFIHDGSRVYPKAAFPGGLSFHELPLNEARAAAAVAYVTVRGSSDTDRSIRKGLLTDGRHAARRADEGGVVAGGGVGYFRSAQALPEQAAAPDLPGVDAVRSALETPLRLLVEQTGGDLQAIRQRITENRHEVYDAKLAQVVVDENGPIDPVLIATDVILQSAETAARIVRTRTWDSSLELNETPTNAMHTPDQQ